VELDTTGAIVQGAGSSMQNVANLSGRAGTATLGNAGNTIASLGPSTIQPVIVARRLPPPLRSDLQSVFLEMGSDHKARAVLAHGFIERFVPVTDGSYDDIRVMSDVSESVKCLSRGSELRVSSAVV
jgi:ABC-type phosphate/phosphonate transport system substrate-binding protein